MRKKAIFLILAVILGAVLINIGGVSAFSIFDFFKSDSVSLSPGSGEIVSDSSVVGLWHMNGDAVDSSSSGNDGSLVGNVDCSVPGKFGNGCRFDGAGDAIDLAENSGLPVYKNNLAYTIAFWVKAPAQSGRNLYAESEGGFGSRTHIGLFQIAIFNGIVIGIIGQPDISGIRRTGRLNMDIIQSNIIGSVNFKGIRKRRRGGGKLNHFTISV